MNEPELEREIQVRVEKKFRDSREPLDPRIKWAIFGGLLLIGSWIVWSVAINPIYQIWVKARYGEAQLREAEYNRQIKVTEAQATLESERLNKQSEVVRAEGVSAANQIIVGSINEQYIRYLWEFSQEKELFC